MTDLIMNLVDSYGFAENRQDDRQALYARNLVEVKIAELTAERDALAAQLETLRYELDAIPAIKAERDALKDAAKLALDFIDLTRRGCESGAVKSKSFINPDPDAATLEILTLHGESLKAIEALKAVL